MNFQITISGEGPELGKALVTLKDVLGEKIGAGSVTADLNPAPAPVQPIPTTPPQQAAQAYQQQQAYAPPPTTPAVAPTAPPQGTVPTSTPPAYTMEQLGVAAGPLVDTGRGPELTGWLQQRGAGALTQLDPAHYGDFATYLRSLGARI